MTIAPGQLWGERRGAVLDAPIASSDAAIAGLIANGRHHRGIVLTGGELWASLGGASVIGRSATEEAHHYSIDALSVTLGGSERPYLAIAHVAGFRRYKPVAVIGNIGNWRRYRALPRAHPNDGELDGVWGRLPWSALVTVASRARTGTHLPHPSLQVRRAPSVEVEPIVGSRVRWEADGRTIGRAARARVEVIPDAAVVIL
jgi:hypothetical protein